MNLDDALRSLFLRQLRADRLEAEAGGQPESASKLGALATALQVERDKATKQYRVSLAGTPHVWDFPESEFQFYTRGDRAAPGSVSPEDEPFESNRRNARKWLEIFRHSFNA